MKKRQAICIVIDGLRASALGCYGNTISSTPSFDRLASRSVVADWMWADSPELHGFYQSAWSGLHALRTHAVGQSTPLLDALHKQDVRQWLVTDEPWLVQQAAKLPFDDDLLIESQANRAAEEIEGTHLAQLFSETIERLAEWQADNSSNYSSGLLWLHARGMAGPWDAPREMRADLLDEEDPDAPDFVEPPRELSDINDPDQLLEYQVAYAAQVAVVDACIGAFYQSLGEVFSDSDTLVMLLGSRGMALGEHGSIGTDCQQLYSEQLHLPWLTHTLGNHQPLARDSQLRQPADVAATLANWFGANEDVNTKDGIYQLPGQSQLEHDARTLAVTQGPAGEMAIRTPAWLMRVLSEEKQGEQESSPELYVKPDDRWEHNNVAVRCPDIIKKLHAELERYLECCDSEKALPLSPADAELKELMR